MLVLASAVIYQVCAAGIASADACPISLSDFMFVGQSASGMTRVYNVNVASENQHVLAHINATDAANKTTQLLLPQYPAKVKIPKCCGVATIEWYGSPIGSVQVIDYKDDTDPNYIPCSAQPVHLGPSPTLSKVVTFPETPTVASLGWGSSRHLIADADFVTRKVPAYPVPDHDLGIVGTVIVLFDVTPTGKPEHAVVATSSQDPNLDVAAVRAISQSTFKPATVDGIPATRRYKVEYDFGLDEGDRRTPIRPNAKCGARIDSVLIEGADLKASDYLYKIEFSAADDTVSAVTFVLGKGEATGPAMVWSDPTWSASEDKSYAATLYVLDHGVQAGNVSLDSITQAATSNKPECTLVPIITWDDSDGMLDGSAPQQLDPAATQHSQIIVPPPMVGTVWPAYPDSARDQKLVGTTLIVVDVDTAGKATAARVFKTAGTSDLDDAAAGAALRRAYPKTALPRTYIMTFEFRLTSRWDPAIQQQ